MNQRDRRMIRLLREDRQPLDPRFVDEDNQDEPTPDGPFRDGKLWVLTDKCATCVFRPGNPMHLRDGVVDDMVRHSVLTNTVFACHETLDGPRSVCKGLVDVYHDHLGIIQVAERLDLLAYHDQNKDT